MTAIALALVVLLMRHDQGKVGGMSTRRLCVAFGQDRLAGRAWRRGAGGVPRKFGTALRIVLIWVVIALMLALGYTYRFELRGVYDRVMAEMVPGRAATRGRIVEIARGQAGEFGITTQVNGGAVPMVLDTGATAVVLTQEAAKAAGSSAGSAERNIMVDTANGKTRAAAVTLDRIGVGGLIERSVPALIAQPGQLRRACSA